VAKVKSEYLFYMGLMDNITKPMLALARAIDHGIDNIVENFSRGASSANTSLNSISKSIGRNNSTFSQWAKADWIRDTNEQVSMFAANINAFGKEANKGFAMQLPRHQLRQIQEEALNTSLSLDDARKGFADLYRIKGVDGLILGMKALAASAGGVTTNAMMDRISAGFSTMGKKMLMDVAEASGDTFIKSLGEQVRRGVPGAQNALVKALSGKLIAESSANTPQVSGVFKTWWSRVNQAHHQAGEEAGKNFRSKVLEPLSSGLANMGMKVINSKVATAGKGVIDGLKGFVSGLAIPGAKRPAVTGSSKQGGGLGGMATTGLSNLLGSIQPMMLLITALEPVINSLKNMLMPLLKPLQDLLLGVVSALQPLVDALLPLIKSIFDALNPVITSLASILANVLGSAIQMITPIIMIVANVLGTLLQVLVPIIHIALLPLVLLFKVLGAIFSAIQPIFDTLNQMWGEMSGLFSELMDAFMPLIDMIMPLFTWQIKLVSWLLMKLFEPVQEAIEDFRGKMQWFTGLFTNFPAQIKKFLAGLPWPFSLLFGGGEGESPAPAPETGVEVAAAPTEKFTPASSIAPGAQELQFPQEDSMAPEPSPQPTTGGGFMETMMFLSPMGQMIRILQSLREQGDRPKRDSEWAAVLRKLEELRKSVVSSGRENKLNPELLRDLNPLIYGIARFLSQS